MKSRVRDGGGGGWVLLALDCTSFLQYSLEWTEEPSANIDAITADEWPLVLIEEYSSSSIQLVDSE